MTKRAPRRTGRPRLLEIDPSLHDRIAALVRQGAHPAQAAQACGIAPTTHHRWVAAGLEERAHQDAGNSPRAAWATWSHYVQTLEQADALAEMDLLERATSKGNDAHGAFAILERRFPWWGTKPYKGPRSLYPTPEPASGPGDPVTLTPLDTLAQRRHPRWPR